MITVWLQDRLDVMRVTSRQRWVLVAAAVLSAVVASAATGVPGAAAPWLTGFVGVLALVAAGRPGSQGGLLVVAIVAWRWLAAVDDVASPWSIVVAIGLLAFHGLLALMAVTPHSAVVGGPVLRRWLGRTAGVGAATVATWGAVALAERSAEPGSAGLTAVALLVLAAATLVARTQSLPSPSAADPAR